MKKNEQDILSEVRERFLWSVESEGHNREQAVDDQYFFIGDQWPKELEARRTAAGRPTEVINKLPGFVDQIEGEIRQSNISIKVKSTGKPGSKETAELLQGMIRTIENLSCADVAYQTGSEGNIISGRGAWRICTEYVDEDVFDQDIRIKRIKNAYTVYCDPTAEEWDKSDARYMFISEEIGRKEFEARYPGKEPANFSLTQVGDDLKYWTSENTVRIAEFWCKIPIRKTIYKLSDGRIVDSEKYDKIIDDLKAQEQPVYMNQKGEVIDGVPEPGQAIEGSEHIINKAPEIVKEKTVESHKIVSYIVDGSQIVSGPHEWAGAYIPIVLLTGKEINIEGKDYYKGLIRDMKGPQRMYNYQRNSEIEDIAMQKKAPIRMTPEQFEGNEHTYDPNINNMVQLYNHKAGQPPPMDTAPRQASSGNINQAMQSNDEMKATSSIFDASRGARSNETSGVAIRARQAQGNTANYAYSDNLKRAIRYTGKILVDLIPRIYDSERQICIFGEDGTEKEVKINETVLDKATGKSVVLNDLSIGKYAVTVSSGPHFDTQREETRTNMIELARYVPAVGTVGADLIAQNMDFNKADELAERLKKTLPLGIIEDEKTQAVNEQEQQPQQPSPEEIAAQLELKEKELDVQKKELEVQEQALEVQEKQIEVQSKAGNIEKLLQGAAEGGATAIINKLRSGQQEQQVRQPQAPQDMSGF